MHASWNGHKEVVHTLLQFYADVNAQTAVRNQMMMIVINDEDRDNCRY